MGFSLRVLRWEAERNSPRDLSISRSRCITGSAPILLEGSTQDCASIEYTPYSLGDEAASQWTFSPLPPPTCDLDADAADDARVRDNGFARDEAARVSQVYPGKVHPVHVCPCPSRWDRSERGRKGSRICRFRSISSPDLAPAIHSVLTKRVGELRRASRDKTLSFACFIGVRLPSQYQPANAPSGYMTHADVTTTVISVHVTMTACFVYFLARPSQALETTPSCRGWRRRAQEDFSKCP